MPRKLNVVLERDGVWDDGGSVPKRAGIYMVLASLKSSAGSWDTSSYELLDIGQSGETGVRLDIHERRDCWGRRKSSNKTIVFKFAVMSSEKYDETDRRIVECCLRAYTKPLCGTECNEGYTREDSVSITNSGMNAPLKNEYHCGP